MQQPSKTGNYWAFDARNVYYSFLQNGLRHFRLDEIHNQPSGEKACMPGDLVVGIKDAKIHYVGKISASDQVPKYFHSIFGHQAMTWVDITALEHPIPLSHEVIEAFPYELQAAVGEGKQLAYQWLASVIHLAGKEIHAVVAHEAGLPPGLLQSEEQLDSFLDRQAFHALLADADISAGEKRALFDAFNQQGDFLTACQKLARRCPFSGVSHNLQLLAIKPWRSASLAEKIDPENRIWVADFLAEDFMTGMIAVCPDGRIVYTDTTLECNYDDVTNRTVNEDGSDLTAKQREYLDYHYKHVFRDNRVMPK